MELHLRFSIQIGLFCDMTELLAPARITQRLPRIDVLRGIAVLAMIVYHFAWDLTFFGLIETNVATHPLWSRFAMAIAGSFLLLSGISLDLSTHDGVDWSKFTRRLIILAGAAALVSSGTYIATPNSFVFFGILHCIALGSLFALLFLRLHIAVIAGMAVLVFVTPLSFTHSIFNQPNLLWIGLGTVVPNTSDYVPIFPWFAYILAGIVIARLMPAQRMALAINANILTKIGRRSLLIYLLHQPILMALVGTAAFVLPMAGEQRIAEEFRNSCRESCQQSISIVDRCPRFCSCVEDKLKTQNLWIAILRNRLSDDQESRVNAVTEQCSAATR
jgi:uncharacterized membrane protein